jgi:cytochrome c oxidase assembly protein subunit 15
LCASFFALGVIGLGATTRLLDAGLGCPDWPGCYGHFIVPTAETGQVIVAYKAWAEMIHRYFVGGLSVLILAVIAMIVSKKSLRVRHNLILAGMLILLLAYQIMLGQWTVTLKLLPAIVTQHLLGGFLILSMLWLVYLHNRASAISRSLLTSPSSRAAPSAGSSALFDDFTGKGAGSRAKSMHGKTRKRLMGNDRAAFLVGALLALLLLFSQITLGAWTSTNYASLSCPDFPFCMRAQTMTWQFSQAFHVFSPVGVNYEGGVLSTAVRQTIQMTHRFGALILTCYLFVFMAIAFMRLHHFPRLMKSLYVIMGLLCVQLCIGISNVIFKLPLVTAVSHTLIAALLLLSVMTLIYQLTKIGGKT